MDINYVDDNSDIPSTETFKCLLNVDLLQTALDFQPPTQESQVIVVLREYEYLREALENNWKGWFFVVTGQPGTGSSSYCPLSSGNHTSRFCILHKGKTLFVLYLLLYRLEKELPTAVQFSETEYIFFDAKGGSRRSTISDDSETLPRGCWCLCDGSAYVEYPCHHFTRSGLFTFLVTSASPETYKKWRNQTDAITVVKALPRTVEVAAIAWVLNSYLLAAHIQSCRKMHGFRPCDAISVSQRWGPSIRTIFAILRDRRKEKDHEANDASRVVGGDMNKPADKMFEGGSLTWLQRFLNLL